MLRRRDGTLARVPAYRRVMPLLMTGRNESAVYLEQTLDLSRALPWLDGWRADGRVRPTIFHLVLRALADVLHERPRLNRFVAGGRLYDRAGVWLSFAAKKRMDDAAPLATVKREFPAGESFAAMVAGVAGDVVEARGDRPRPVDRELALLERLPVPVVAAAVRLLRRADALGLAPRALTDPDPMYASAFVANLGSLGLDAAYHHLYEHGTCSLFVALGAVAPRPVVAADGSLAVRPTAQLRYTYDERVEDGLYCARALEALRRRVEDPEASYGPPGAAGGSPPRAGDRPGD